MKVHECVLTRANRHEDVIKSLRGHVPCSLLFSMIQRNADCHLPTIPDESEFGLSVKAESLWAHLCHLGLSSQRMLSPAWLHLLNIRAVLNHPQTLAILWLDYRASHRTRPFGKLRITPLKESAASKILHKIWQNFAVSYKDGIVPTNHISRYKLHPFWKILLYRVWLTLTMMGLENPTVNVTHLP